MSLPKRYVAALRRGSPPVLGRILRGRCLLDLRALPSTADAELLTAVLADQ